MTYRAHCIARKRATSWETRLQKIRDRDPEWKALTTEGIKARESAMLTHFINACCMTCGCLPYGPIACTCPQGACRISIA